jgi:hypothetical protein
MAVGVFALPPAISSALALLPKGERNELQRSLELATFYRQDPRVRVAVYGPFNQGKSTLINALLGSQVLPADLVPTTGVPVVTTAGSVPSVRVILADGRRFKGDLGLLRRFAILDEERRTSEEVAMVEVDWPCSFLAPGVVVVDLPGTDDQPDREEVVRQQLLAADLIVQVLDARKLFTLGERAQVENWLIERGITDVLFVINFLNLIPPEDRPRIEERARAVASWFPGSSIFSVDALPALRARLRDDDEGALSSGLAAFQQALEKRIAAVAADRKSHREPRLRALGAQLRSALEIEGRQIKGQLAAFEAERAREDQVRCQALTRLWRVFEGRLNEGRNWLSSAQLLAAFQEELAGALRQGKLAPWLAGVLSPQMEVWLKALNNALREAVKIHGGAGFHPLDLAFPAAPAPYLPPAPAAVNQDSVGGAAAAGATMGGLAGSILPGIGTIVGVMGGAIFGGLSGLVSRSKQQELQRQREAEYRLAVEHAWRQSARDYLERFRNSAVERLNAFETRSRGRFESVTSERGPKEILVAPQLSAVEQAIAAVGELLAAVPV